VLAVPIVIVPALHCRIDLTKAGFLRRGLFDMVAENGRREQKPRRENGEALLAFPPPVQSTAGRVGDYREENFIS